MHRSGSSERCNLLDDSEVSKQAINIARTFGVNFVTSTFSLHCILSFFLRAEGASLVLGPFNLEEGKNRHWSSTLEDCYIEGKYLTSRSGAAVGPGRNSSTAFGSVPMPVETTGPTGNRILARPADVFELMVCLAPTAMAAKSSLFSSVSSQREGYTQNQVQSQQRPNDQKSAQLSEPPSTGVHTGAANGRSSSSDWSNRLPPGSSNDSAGITPFFDRESAQSLDGKVRKKPTTPETAVSSLKSTAVSVLSGEVKHTGKTQSRHIAIHTADINLKPDFTGSSNVICEVSYARVLAQKKKEVIKPIESDQNLAAISCQYNVIDGELTEQTDEVDKALEVKCVMQRVQLATGVFFTQDIYGMDRNRIEEDPVAATDDEDVTGEGDGEAVPNAPAASTPAGITLDSDAIECVICLTDNRTIAVYPCRHMCLCASCAEVLPSQVKRHFILSITYFRR